MQRLRRLFDGLSPRSSRAPRAPEADRVAHGIPRPVAPGAMSALLDALARPPDAPPEPPPPLGPGAAVGRYEVVREIGRGGFGIVYEARDRELGRLVALKIVEPRRGIDPAAVREEAEAAAQLQHPAIVTVHDAGTAGDRAWIVLELLRGETLEARLRRGPVAQEEALRIALAVARGLAHAHRAGVVHRDLKPANVFLCEDGAVKILDFGLSRVFGSGSLDGGTPVYMAPERWRGEPGDERADVFAAGAILFELLAGRRPYAMVDERSTALEAERAPPLAAGAPAELRRAVAAAIDPDPARRPRDGAAWLELLLAARGRGGRARSARLVAGVVAVAALGTLVALALSGRHGGREAELETGARIPVAVADVHNGTADPELNGLSGMLVTSLEQSRRLAVLTRSRLVDAIRQLGKEPPEILDEPLAREVGRMLDVRALLLATVHRFDDVYAIELRALDPVRNEYLFTLKEEGRGKSSVPQLIDRLAEGTRERLRVASGEGEEGRRAVADLTTQSLAAYEHFFRARQAIDLRRFEQARVEIEAALRVDPEFALAHHARVVLDAWTRRGLIAGAIQNPSASLEREHLDRALRRVDRLPEKERLALLAWKASLDGRVQEATRLRDAAADAFPQDKEAVFWAGDVRFHQEDLAGAIPFFERALALDPDYRLALEHQIHALLALGRRADVLTWARRWADSARDEESRLVLGVALLLNDRSEEAEEAFRSGGAPAAWRGAALAAWLAHRGRVDEALALLRPLIASGGEGGHAEEGPGRELAKMMRPEKVLMQLLVLQGRWREAERVQLRGQEGAEPEQAALERLWFALGTRSLERVRGAVARLDALGIARHPFVATNTAIALAAARDAPGAQARIGPLRGGAGWESLPPPQRMMLEAVLAWREGRLEEADGRLRTLAARPDVHVRYVASVLRGEVAIERGAAREAIAPLEEAISSAWSPANDLWCWFHPRALYHLAVAYERAGDHPRARTRVDELLRLWSHADPDVPLLAEARALRRRLGGPARTGEAAALQP